jgi:hypothetical protein
VETLVEGRWLPGSVVKMHNDGFWDVAVDGREELLRRVGAGLLRRGASSAAADPTLPEVKVGGYILYGTCGL